MKRMMFVSAVLALACGCATSPMKSTPFYDGADGCYDAKVEDRVNLWPVVYWRDPALSVAWPVYSQADDHWAIHPLYSQYRQGGKGADYDEFNVIWPIGQIDARHGFGRVFPVFWGTDYFDVFPVFCWTKNWCMIGPYATHKTEDRGMLFPLSCWDFEADRFWYLAGLGGYWRCDDYHVNHWMLPLYCKNRSGFCSLPFSRLERKGLTEDLYLCGLGGHAFSPEGYRCSWMFPFYYHDKDSFYTLLYGNTPTEDWMMPFYFRNKTGFHTLLWSVHENEKTGERGLFSLPLLSAVSENTNSCQRSWCAVLGLAGSKTNATGTHHEHWMFPFYHWDEGRSFTSPVYGWKCDYNRTNTWWAAGFVGTREGSDEGEWVFPFYSRKKSVAFDERKLLLEAPDLVAALSSHGLTNGYSRAYNDLSYALIFNDDESVCGWSQESGKDGKTLLFQNGRQIGNLLLFTHDYARRVTLELESRRRLSDTDTFETSLLWFLYRGETKVDRLTQKSSARDRVLWILWDWKREDENVSLNVFPFFTYDSKKSGYSKTSLCWRLFRNEYDPKSDRREVDLLFIPVWR